jgi:uncharacterized Zn finger protein
VVYDARLSKEGIGERQVELTWEEPLAVGDLFTYDGEIYDVTAVHVGHDRFDAVIEAEWGAGPA